MKFEICSMCEPLKKKGHVCSKIFSTVLYSTENCIKRALEEFRMLQQAAQRFVDGALRRVLRSELAAVTSGLPPPLRELLEGPGAGSKHADQLDTKRFEITSVNDLLAGSQAEIAESMGDMQLGRSIRQQARQRRLRAWAPFVESLEEAKRGEVADALSAFEKKELDRLAAVQQSMEDWRKDVASKDPNAPSGKKGKNAGASIARWFGMGGSPEVTLKEQLAAQIDHERKLLQTFQRLGIDVDVSVNKLLRGHSSALALASAADSPNNNEKTRDLVYVLNFRGDMRPTQVESLKDEITAVLSLPEDRRPDEIVLNLYSGGGSVSGYGLAETELRRIKAAGISLTCTVDQVAASGGYMIACVADTIICTSWASIGSIGVMSGIPNAAEFMEKKGLKFYKLTAGKNKNNLDPFTKPTDEGIAHVQSDMERTLEAFSEHVATNRGDRLKKPISEIAQGDVWLGADALSLGLVDKISTSEEYILGRVQDDAEVFQLKKIKKKKKNGPWASSGATNVDFEATAMGMVLGPDSSTAPMLGGTKCG